MQLWVDRHENDAEAVPSTPAPAAAAPADAVSPSEALNLPVLSSRGADKGITPLEFTGSFFTRYELREGYDEHSTPAHALDDPRLHREGDSFVYRARFGIQTHPVNIGRGQSVLVNFTPQAAGTHSTQGTPETIADQPALGLYEAFVRLQSKGFRFDVGRFNMNYGDGFVIGQNDWHEAGRAFQGGRVRLTSSTKDDYFTDVFLTLIQEGAPLSNAAFRGDQYFYGAYTSLGALGAGPSVDVYLLGRTFGGMPGDDEATPIIFEQQGATGLTFGARAAQALDQFDYRFEAGIQFGQSLQPAGNDPLNRIAFQADAAVGVLPVKSLRVELGGVAISGEENPNDDLDHAWDPLFPTGHAPLGISDVIAVRSNVLSANLGLRYDVASYFSLDAKGHLLGRWVENLAGNRYVGTEIDAGATYALGMGTRVRGAYAIVLPSHDYWGADENALQGDPIQFLELQLGYSF